jgi:hypothetical protein
MYFTLLIQFCTWKAEDGSVRNGPSSYQFRSIFECLRIGNGACSHIAWEDIFKPISRNQIYVQLTLSSQS